MRTKSIVVVVVVLCLINSPKALAACPSADLTGDCFVDFEDFSLMANQWPTEYDYNDLTVMAAQWLTPDPCVPDDMVYIPDGEFQMGDSFGEGRTYEHPVHTVTLDSFYMGKYEVTNQQYCDYLNSAYPGQIKVISGVVYASSDDPCDYPYCDTHGYDYYSQIDYNDVSETFSVRTKGEPPRDMSDDPMLMVSWYGAVAYCNWRSSEEGFELCYDINDPNWECDFSKHGYRLPTEAEWEYAARGGLSGRRFPWGDTISHSQANYYAAPFSYPYDVSPTSGFHRTWSDGIYPFTSPVGSFSANGYGVYDMTGNVHEWCNDWFSMSYYSSSPVNNPTGPTSGFMRVLRSGYWHSFANYCRVASRYYYTPDNLFNHYGFRLSLDLN